MKKFWMFLGAVVILAIVGGLIYRMTYVLRTGRDLAAERAAAAAALIAANNGTTATQVGNVPVKPAAVIDDSPTFSIADL